MSDPAGTTALFPIKTRGPVLDAMQVHPAIADFLIAKHDLVGNETFFADLDEIVPAGQIGRNFRILADLGAH